MPDASCAPAIDNGEFWQLLILYRDTSWTGKAVDLKRLEYFLKIAELGSLNRATDYLRISQPSLSRQMRLLEEELGVQLFRRHRRGMQLTLEGEELQERLNGPIRQVGLALRDVRSLSGQAVGEVTIGMLASTAMIFAGRLAQKLSTSDPNIRLRIVEGFAGNFVRALECGEIDIALLYEPSSHWQFTTEKILSERLVLVGPPDCDLSPDRPVQYDDLHKYPLILPNPIHHPDVIRTFVNKFSNSSDNRLNVSINADAVHMSKIYIKFGLGYGLITLSACYDDVKNGVFKYAPIENPVMPLQMLLATHPTSRFPRATNRVKQIIEQELKDMIENGLWVGASP